MIIVEFVKKIIKNEKSYLLAPLIFFIITISFSFVLYNNVHYIYEIGFIEQAEWNTLNGNFFSSVSNGGNHFARHNSPILFIFLPIYYLFENITIFIILTNLLIAISAVPIYLFAKEYLKSKKAGIVFMISYLLFPSFYYSNLRSFHPIMLSVSFLAFALYFLYKKNVKFFLISIILAMLTNETVSFIVFMIGIYTLIKYDKKLGLILMIIGITWFQLSTTVIMPHFSTETKYPFIKELYGHLGTDFKEIITTIITKPGYALSYGSLEGKIIYFRSLFQHTFFISLLAPEVLIIGIPVIIQNIFSASGYKYDILAHYSYPLIPLIMYATIIGIKRIRKLFKKNILNNILILVLITSLLSNITFGIIPLVKENCYLFDGVYSKNECPITGDIIGQTPKENFPSIKEAVSMIPQGASVMAQNHIYYLVSDRKATYLFELFHNCNYADYFIFDSKGNIAPVKNPDIYIKETTNRMGYKITYQKGSIYLLKNTNFKESCFTLQD